MAMFRLAAIRAAMWVGLELVGGSVFSTIGLLVIASIIGPRDLGLSTIVLGIAQTANFLPETLFYDAIIQRRRLTTRHLGSAFWAVCALSLVISLVIAGLAYPIGQFYDEPLLRPLLLVLSASSVFSAVASVQSARLRRAMRMRTLALYAVTSRSSSTLAGLILAVVGYGPWAMIAQYELGLVVLALLLGMTTKWRFVRSFSFVQAGELGRFAVTRTACQFIDAARVRLFFVLLSNYLPLQVLGEVSLAFRLVDSLTVVISSAIGRFCLPVFSRVQSNNQGLAVPLWQMSSTTAVILMPLYAILALTGDNLVHLFASERWQDMQGLIVWLSVAGTMVVLWTPAYSGILATGRPAVLAITSASVLFMLVTAIWLTRPTSGIQAVVCWTAPLLVSWPVTLVITRYAIGLSIRNQVTCLAPAALATASITATMLGVPNLLSWNAVNAVVFGEVAVAGLTYVGFMAILYLLLLRRVEHGRQLIWLPPEYSGEAR